MTTRSSWSGATCADDELSLKWSRSIRKPRVRPPRLAARQVAQGDRRGETRGHVDAVEGDVGLDVHPEHLAPRDQRHALPEEPEQRAGLGVAAPAAADAQHDARHAGDLPRLPDARRDGEGDGAREFLEQQLLEAEEGVAVREAELVAIHRREVRQPPRLLELLRRP